MHPEFIRAEYLQKRKARRPRVTGILLFIVAQVLISFGVLYAIGNW